jgi:hypothetical protein
LSRKYPCLGWLLRWPPSWSTSSVLVLRVCLQWRRLRDGSYGKEYNCRSAIEAIENIIIPIQ